MSDPRGPFFLTQWERDDYERQQRGEAPRGPEIKTESFIGEDTLAKMRQAKVDHPATEHTSAGGWCKHCGCGNDVLGYKHLKSCAVLPDSDIAAENERLRLENWQLKGALGYPVPGHIPQGDFKCGLCEARAKASNNGQLARE